MRRDAAILAGAVFAFAPARLFRISQLHLTTIQWVPFTLAFLHTYLDSRKPRDLRLAIAFFTLQVLTSGHGAVFVIVAAAALIVYRLALREPIEPDATREGRRTARESCSSSRPC